MPSCSVFSCKKRSQTSSLQKDNVTFHLFPRDAMMRYVWIQVCGNHVSWVPKRTSTICSQHFETCYFIVQSNNKRRLKEGAVPTLNLPKVDRFGEPELELPEASTSIRKNLELPQSREHNLAEGETSQSEVRPTPVTLSYKPQLDDTPRNRRLIKVIQFKNKQIKRLQSQKKYLKKKVTSLKDLLKKLTKKSLIEIEERLVLDKISVEEKELLNRQLLKS